ncbi:MAG: cytochrome c oxidase subunit II [bacterium]|nr:cytochrome c oxidase subunit II [bacterium]
MPSPLLPGSPFAQAIVDLAVPVALVCAAILLLVTGLITVVLVRFRGGRGVPEPPQVAGARPLELLWTAIPLVLVIGMFVLTARTMRAADPPIDREADVVVVAHQWWWEVRYPAANVVTANEIHLPVAAPILVRVESADVVHDFWVPQLGRKVDAIPGHPNHVWVSADAAGEYHGACAEFCGTQHAWMRLLVVAQEPADYAAWLAGQQTTPPAPTDAAGKRGAALFAERTCIACHAIAGTTPTPANAAPDLTHLMSRRTLGAGVLQNGPDELTRWLMDPQTYKPGSKMPDLELTPAEVADLVAYLGALR